MRVRKKVACNEDCFNCVYADCRCRKIYLPNEREFSDCIDKMILKDREPKVNGEWYLQGTIKDHEVKLLVANM